MIALSYVSSATSRPSDDELLELLDKARQTNNHLNVTGLLLYNGRGTYIQVLEGDEQVVEALYQKIQQDPRHTRIHCISKRVVNERSFAQWQMGFHRLSSTEAIKVEGFSDFMSQEDGSQYVLGNTGFVGEMLAYFRQYSKELVA